MSEMLQTVATEQRLLALAVEINTIRDQTRSTVLTAACEIGKRLIEAKNNLHHGMWGDWLTNNVDFSERQAQQLMALYDEYGNDPRALGALSVSQAAALLAAPDEVREEMLESGAAAELSVRELREEIARQREEIERRQVRIDELTAEAGAADVRVADAERSATEAARQKKQAERERNEALADVKAAKRELRTAIDAKGAAERERDDARRELDELRAAPVEQVEVTPPEVEAELEALRARLRTAPSAPVILAREAYSQATALFERMIEQLRQMDEPTRAQYGPAFARGLRKMAERMETER